MLSFQVQNQIKTKAISVAKFLEHIISDCKKVNQIICFVVFHCKISRLCAAHYNKMSLTVLFCLYSQSFVTVIMREPVPFSGIYLYDPWFSNISFVLFTR